MTLIPSKAWDNAKYLTLGVSRGNVLKLILGQGLTLTGIGVVLGLAGAFGMTSMISVLLYGISPPTR